MTEQIGIEDYHASERISSSKLRTFMALGPRAYYLRHVLKSNVLKPSKPMIVGQAFEDAICGRDTFKVIEGDGRTKLVKQQKAEAEAEGKPSSSLVSTRILHELWRGERQSQPCGHGTH